MIGIVDVEIQAANPSMPLYPVRAFKNSPTSVRLRNVPKAIGNWKITSVQIVAEYPDNSIKTANCVLTGGVWVGTIDGCATSGKTENGFTVFASGIDENGNAVSNYVLGKGLVEILNGDGTITPDDNKYYVHLCDEEPTQPKEGDVWSIDGGYVIWQDGHANPLGFIPTEAQLSSIDSGITSAKVEAYDIALENSNWSLVDKTPISGTTSATVALDNKTVNNISLELVTLPWSWTITPDGDQFRLNPPSYVNGDWVSTDPTTGNIVLYWQDPEQQGEDATNLTYWNSGFSELTFQFGKPVSQVQIGETVTATGTVMEETVQFQFEVYDKYDYMDQTEIYFWNGIAHLSYGLKVAIYNAALFIPSTDTSGSGEFDWNTENWATRTIQKAQNVTSLEFPQSINGRSRTFYLRVVMGEDTTRPTFPSGVITYDGDLPVLNDGNTYILFFTETIQNKFNVKDVTAYTTSQKAALDSGITSAKVAYYDNALDGLESLINSI